MANINSDLIDENVAKSKLWLVGSFRWLFFGALFSTFAGKIYEIFLPLLVYRLTHSPQIMGWMRAVEFLPYVLFAIVIGVLIDRVSRKLWCQWMLIGQIGCLVISWLAVKYTVEPLWLLFPCSFFMMAFNFGYLNARMGLVKELLPSSQQGTASAAFSSLTSIFQTIGPVLSGVVLLFSDFSFIYLVMASLVFLSWFTLNNVSLTDKPLRKKTKIINDIKIGFQELKKNRKLLKMSFSVSIFNMCMLMFVIQSLYFTQNNLHFNSVNIGIMVSSVGIGGILGALISGFLRKKIGLGSAFILGVLLQAVVYFVLIFDKSDIIFYFVFFFGGFFESIVGVTVYTFRQESTRSEHLGKVMGITGTIFKISSPFGLVASGYIMSFMGINTLLSICCGLHILSSFYLIANKDVKGAS